MALGRDVRLLLASVADAIAHNRTSASARQSARVGGEVGVAKTTGRPARATPPGTTSWCPVCGGVPEGREGSRR